MKDRKLGEMRFALLCRIFLSVIFLSVPLQLSVADEGDPSLFTTRIQPLLAGRCESCHGPDEQEGSLRLDSREAALKGGKQGPALVVGKPAESLLVRAVKHETEKLAMPPKEHLSVAEIAALVRWIEEGAPWPATQPLKPSTPAGGERIGNAWVDPRNPIAKLWHGERLDLWSLKPIQRPVLPVELASPSSSGPIDALLAAPQRGEADRRTLIRRLAFDLTGLPPMPSEVEEFQADQRPDAYERLVDRLLATPAFGEHQARAWLDIVRYSDSNGFDWDEFRPRAWRFRDYVIRSLNADKPFDQFVREQLAGDELLAGPPQTPAEQDLLIATGYLRIGPQDNSSSLFNEQARSRSEWMNDLVETTAGGFLGLTFNCCRCHDHKFDPISQADFYRLRAFFEPLKYADDLPLDLAPEQEAIRQHNGEIDKQVAAIQEQRDELLAGTKLRLEKADAKEDEVRKAFSEEEKQRDEKLAKEIGDRNSQRRTFTLGLLATDTEGDVPATRVLYQGDYKAGRDAVEPGFLSVLDPNAAPLAKAANHQTKGRRLALAAWITAPENALAARVLANRLWQGHFGRGLVETPSDFGLAGAKPTHPILLDWLASEVQSRGWSQKDLHRRIVSSATYRRAGADSPRRLTAEQLRDAMLAVSGLLTSKASGPPVWPELPSEVLTANPAFLDDNAEKTKGWYPSPGLEQHARSIFQVQKRTVRVPFMETFDLPENIVSCSRRNTSLVAPQALALLNSPLAIEAARALAERVQREMPADAAKPRPVVAVDVLYRLTLQREPTGDESSACVELLEKEGLVQLCRVMLNLNEFIYID